MKIKLIRCNVKRRIVTESVDCTSHERPAVKQDALESATSSNHLGPSKAREFMQAQGLKPGSRRMVGADCARPQKSPSLAATGSEPPQKEIARAGRKVQLNVKVDEAIKREALARCAREGIHLQDVVDSYLYSWLANSS